MNSEGSLFDSIRGMSARSPDEDRARAEIWKRFGTRCAVMVLDCSGFTLNTRSCGIIGYLSCVARLREIVAGLLPKHGCTDCRYFNDDVFAEFETAEAALQAAFGIQAAVRNAGIELRDGSCLEVCIGIGYGDVLRSRSEGVFGDEMNLASKLGEDIAGPGEILLTRSAFEAVTARSRRGFERMRTSVSGVDIEYYKAAASC